VALAAGGVVRRSRYSRLTAQPVGTALAEPLRNSLALMLSSMTLAALLALPAGVIAALRQGRWLDHALNLAAFAAISLPCSGWAFCW